jgi:hypothetical protein
MGAILSPETFVIMYQTSPYHNGEYYNMNFCDSENLSSYWVINFLHTEMDLFRFYTTAVIYCFVNNKRFKIFIWRVKYNWEIFLQYILI